MEKTADLLILMSETVYQTLLETHQQHPDWFQEKFKSYSWDSSEFKDKFITRLIEKFSPTDELDTVILKIISLLLNVYLPIFFNSPQFTQLIGKLRQLCHPGQNTALSNQGLSVLLLDAENLSLEGKVERLLEKLANYPLKIKLAVANWRGLGKKDEELRQRGYDLIHVPKGKNSADFAMISLGASIFLHSCLVKEVFVCSADKDLDSLITQLNQKGLMVHRVSRQADQLIFVNTKTRKTQQYSISSIPDISSLQEFINKLKLIVIEEQKRTQKQWIQLARISQIYSDQTGLKISQVVNEFLPGKRARDIFLEFKEVFGVHQTSENSQIYVTLFEEETPPTVNNSNTSPTESEISSQEILKTAVVKIVQSLSEQSKQEYVSISNVGDHFKKQYNVSITEALKNLKLSQKFPNFLKSCEQLKLKQNGKTYQVALK